MTQLLGATQGATTIMPTTAQIPTEADEAPDEEEAQPVDLAADRPDRAAACSCSAAPLFALLSNQKAPGPVQTDDQRVRRLPTPNRAHADTDPQSASRSARSASSARPAIAAVQDPEGRRPRRHLHHGRPRPAIRRMSAWCTSTNPSGGNVTKGTSVTLNVYADLVSVGAPTPPAAPTVAAKAGGGEITPR